MKKKTLLLSLTAIIVVAALAVGGTLAYFTGADKADNTFTVGNVNIDLFEHGIRQDKDTYGQSTWTKLETTVDNNTYTDVYPGAVLPKDPAVKNTGNNPAYVVLYLTIDNSEAWGITDDNVLTYLSTSQILRNLDTTNWSFSQVQSGSDSVTYIFYYNSILKSNEITPPLFQSIAIPSSFTNSDMTNILNYSSSGGSTPDSFVLSVSAKAIQSEGFANFSEAWTALNT